MPSATPILSVVYFAVAALLGSVGQWLYREGARTADGTLLGYVANARIVGGVVCYVAVMVLFVAAYRRGGSMAVLYPVYASTFVWSLLVASVAESQPIRLVHVAGIAAIVTGMWCLGR